MDNFDNENAVTGNAKVFAILAYLFGIGWLLGLLIEPEKHSPFVKCHVNNGIWVLIMNFIPVIGNIAAFICIIIGIINAAQDKTWEIPVLGGIKIVK